MPRKPQPWFRFYVETFSDRKIRRLAPAQRWLWAAILGAARESPVPGSLYVTEGLPMTRRELADYADVREREIGPALDLMAKLNMLSVGTDGLIVVTNFAARQFQSDTSTDRTRRHRSNHNTGNGVGTFQQRSRERSGNGGGNAPETETETETETELGSVDPQGGGTAPHDQRPTPHCPDHPDGTDRPCGRCADRRRRAENWDSQLAAAHAEARAGIAAARAACPRCDQNGLIDRPDGRGLMRCDHQPATEARTA